MAINGTNDQANDVNGTAGNGHSVASGRGGKRASQVVIMRNPLCETLRTGTWNVRTMLRPEKIENIKVEMKKQRLNILGLCEIRWKGQGDIMSDEVRLIYSGGDENQRGVGIMIDKTTAKSVTKITYCNDRLMLVRIKAIPTDLVLIMVYMPTSDHPEEEIDEMYDKIENLIDGEQGRHNTIIMGDWNAVVGEGKESDIVGPHGLGNRNERGEKLIEFCTRKELFVTNTWFKHPARRRYTWKQPGDINRYQLDYILTKKRFRNGVKDSKSYPGADADSDHNLVIMKMNVKLKRIKSGKKKESWNKDKIQREEGQMFKNDIEEGIYRVDQHEGIEEKWNEFKRLITECGNTHIGRQNQKRAKKPWVTSAMLEKMEERRKWKNVNTTDGHHMYRKLNDDLRRITNEAREKWWQEQCEEIENLNRRGRSDLVYERVRYLSGGNKQVKMNKGILDEDGTLLTENEDVKKRWVQYIEKLYSKEEKPTTMELESEEEVEEDSKGPDISLDEVRADIKDLKKGKSEGTDDIPSEFLKVLGERGQKTIADLCNQMYKEGTWPEDFTRCVLIPLEKKTNTVKCEEHRTISLIAHTSKIMLKILTRRIENKAEAFLGEDQFGFRRGKGTREAIAIMRLLCERSIEHDRCVHTCFVDYEKAFDRVRWPKLIEILKNIGVDWRDRRMVSQLYMHESITIRVANEETEPGIVGRGVRQGCPLSPLLFNIYAEAMVQEAMSPIKEGVKVGGRVVKAVRFADDQAMVADSEEGLQRMITSLNQVVERYGMKINIKKTKIMKVGRERSNINVSINDERLEQVREFKYLGSTISEDGRCRREITYRIAMAKQAFNKRKELLAGGLNMNLKKRMIKCLVWSVLLYGCETWTMNKKEIDKMEACEMWLWRRMLKVNWSERVSNEEILERCGEQRSIIKDINQRKKKWAAHNLRHESLLKTVIEGRFEGNRSRGRPRKGMLESVMEGSFVTFKRSAQARLL